MTQTTLQLDSLVKGTECSVFEKGKFSIEIHDNKMYVSKKLLTIIEACGLPHATVVEFYSALPLSCSAVSQIIGINVKDYQRAYTSLTKELKKYLPAEVFDKSKKRTYGALPLEEIMNDKEKD